MRSGNNLEAPIDFFLYMCGMCMAPVNFKNHSIPLERKICIIRKKSLHLSLALIILWEYFFWHVHIQNWKKMNWKFLSFFGVTLKYKNWITFCLCCWYVCLLVVSDKNNKKLKKKIHLHRLCAQTRTEIRKRNRKQLKKICINQWIYFKFYKIKFVAQKSA